MLTKTKTIKKITWNKITEIKIQLVPKETFLFSFSLTWCIKITKTKTEIKILKTTQTYKKKIYITETLTQFFIKTKYNNKK